MAPRRDLLPGTLDMLILKTLSAGPLHGYGIALHVKESSRDALQIDEGSLYPALQRMRQKGWISAEWKRTPNNQRARYYTLTTLGEKQLGIEQVEFAEMLLAIRRVMRSV